MAFLDVPCNVGVRSIGGRGLTGHGESPEASGEMSRAEYVEFLVDALGNCSRVSRDGAIHFVCCDWRQVSEITAAGRLAYGETLNIVVWVKSKAGQGSFYRSQHEFVVVFRVGEAEHVDNVEQPARSFTFERVELPRCEHASCRRGEGQRSYLTSSVSPLLPTCGTAPPRRRCPGYLFRLEDDNHGGRADQSARLRNKSNSSRRRHSSLASPAGRSRCRGGRTFISLRRNTLTFGAAAAVRAISRSDRL